MDNANVAKIWDDTETTRLRIEELTLANHEGNYTPKDPEWHEIRARGIGGSEIGTICGLSQYESPYALWAKKSGKLEDNFGDSEAMYWGRAQEFLIVKRFAEEHPDFEIFYNCGTWSHTERSWQIANPDAIYLDANGQPCVLEIKTAQYEDQWDKKTNTVPPSYRAQVLWYLSTFGFKSAKIAVLFHGNKYEEFDIVPSQFELDVNLQLATEFQSMVTEDRAPDFDGANSTYEVVRKLHPDIEDKSVELGELGAKYLTALVNLENATEELTEVKSRILDLMDKAKVGTLGGKELVTRQAKGGGAPFLVTKRGVK